MNLALASNSRPHRLESFATEGKRRIPGRFGFVSSFPPFRCGSCLECRRSRRDRAEDDVLFSAGDGDDVGGEPIEGGGAENRERDRFTGLGGDAEVVGGLDLAV